MTLAEAIEAKASGESILGCTIGNFSNGRGSIFNHEENREEEIPCKDNDEYAWSKCSNPIDEKYKNTLLDWIAARPLLDYVYKNDGRCHAVYVWTETKIIFLSKYDDVTTIRSIPCNPGNFHPTMFGGG